MDAAVAPVAGIVGLVLAFLGALHVAWALGNPWPARDRDALAPLVVGTRSVGTMPGRGPTVVVAVLLFTAAVLVWAAGGLVPVPGAPLARVGAAGVGVVLALRGLVGFADERLRPAIRGTPYARWNVRLYSPLCLALAAGVAEVVAGGGI